MEVKIGVQHAPREIIVDCAQDRETVERLTGEALSAGSPLSLTDHKGRLVVVPGDKIAYIEIGTGSSGTVGFR